MWTHFINCLLVCCMYRAADLEAFTNGSPTHTFCDTGVLCLPQLKDEYSNEVTRLARPLPVEYLLVDLAVGFPMEPSYTFYYDEAVTPFPVEDRSDIGEIQVCERKVEARNVQPLFLQMKYRQTRWNFTFWQNFV